MPKEYLGSVHVMVDETARQPAPAGAAEEPAPAAPAPEAPSHAAEMVAQRLEESRAYWDGVRAGLEWGRSTPTDTGVSITGPLAVANAYAPAPVDVFRPEYPLMTTSFDRGRSRHLTLRLLLQDEFAVDREGPFIYPQRAFLRRLALNPFLPRGLSGQGCSRRPGSAR